MDPAALIPVNVVTGFLGSGKTTLLGRLLASPRLAGTAVLVNEFGEVGLDHHLLEAVSESVALLANGCVCCAVRDDLRGALLDLHGRRERGEAPRYDRVVVETSGLADPAPILHTLLADPVLRHHYRPGAVVTVVDAVHGAQQLERYPESAKQVALADRLVLTKTDLPAPPDGGADALGARLAAINPAAPIVDAAASPVEAALLEEDAHRAQDRPAEAGRWFGAGAAAPSPEHRHTHGVASLCIDTGEPIDWTVFGIWFGMLLHCYGRDLLRVKGILDVPELDGPVLLNAVQHTVHPPVHLPEWPRTWRRGGGSGDDGEGGSGGGGDGARRGTRIVFIGRGLDRDRIEGSLAAFRGALAAAPASAPPPPPPPAAAPRPAHDVPSAGAAPAAYAPPPRRGEDGQRGSKRP